MGSNTLVVWEKVPSTNPHQCLPRKCRFLGCGSPVIPGYSPFFSTVTLTTKVWRKARDLEWPCPVKTARVNLQRNFQAPRLILFVGDHRYSTLPFFQHLPLLKLPPSMGHDCFMWAHFISGIQYSTESLKSLVLCQAAVDQYMDVEHAVALSRLESEFQVRIFRLSGLTSLLPWCVWKEEKLRLTPKKLEAVLCKCKRELKTN